MKRLWYGDRGQAAAVIEGCGLNPGDAVGDGDRGQAATVSEGLIANAGDR